MRMYIKEESGKAVNIRIPTGMALNRATAGVISKVCQKNGTDISKEQLRVLIKAVKECKKYHKNWKLVEIDSADGDHVEIVL